MSNSDETIFSSVPFKFIIEGKAFYVNSALVSQFSRPLERMMNGYMSEATQGFARLEDVDIGTFVRFVRWMYSGDYTAAEHSTDVELEEDDEQAAKSPGHPWYDVQIPRISATIYAGHGGNPGYFDSSPGYTPMNNVVPTYGVSSYEISSKHKLKQAFNELRYTGHDVRTDVPPPRPNMLPSEDYTEVFLCHARLYVFAEKYDIQPLKMFAIHRLHQLLKVYRLYPERVVDITSLMRYVYANTRADDKAEPMRALLMHYVGCEMNTLVNSEIFKAFLEEGGSFVGDFLGIVSKRITC